MAQSKVSPNALARDLSKSLGRPVTAKAVRTVARASLAAFDKTKHPAYQSHEYDAAQVRTIRAAFAARGTRTVAKAAPKRRKVAKVAKAEVTA